MTKTTVLRIANTPQTEFLRQAELKAINEGLKFGELDDLKNEY